MQPRLVLALLVLGSLASACGGPGGPHVRLAHAPPSEINAAQESGQPVWYDFEPGDEVPLQFGLLGVAEAITDQPIRMVARRRFSIVVLPGGQTMFSFEGGDLVGANAARWNIALGADEQGGRAALVLMLGREQDVPEQLRQR